MKRLMNVGFVVAAVAVATSIVPAQFSVVSLPVGGNGFGGSPVIRLLGDLHLDQDSTPDVIVGQLNYPSGGYRIDAY